MTKGVLLFAQNNSNMDYVKQAIFCAKQIKKHLGLDVTMVTDSPEYLNKTFTFYKKYINNVITIPRTHTNQTKRYNDGFYASRVAPWNNFSRTSAYDLTPYDETIVMDTDFIVGNKNLLKCFEANDDFLINKKSFYVNPFFDSTTLIKVSERSIEMVWATVFYFKKTKRTEIFFDLIKHIQENYNYYRLIYQISTRNYRNDFAFAIAIHIMNGFSENNWPKELPITIHFTSDKDMLIKKDNDTYYTLLLEEYDYIVSKLSDLNIHFINKDSLNRIADMDFENE